MSYVLVGSAPSPFTRRLRLLMENTPHEFIPLNIYEPAGASELKKLNPTNQIPVLVDEGVPVFDSRVIFNHLNEKHKFEEMSVKKQNVLTVAEGMMTGGVAKFLLVNKSGLDPTQPNMYLERQLERIQSTHEWLLNWMKSAAAMDWDFTTMTVYSAYDWMKFREIHPVAQTPEVADFLEMHSERPIVHATDPRNQ